ncbi:serine/threonine-protein kinase [Chondromyces crocatus]|uniref:Protein kinase n=1 Tax=Chondromyces crocatus TaxID=52 RepID=A0A0K1EJJ4_CHOCO|nr:serine/threonine-protein kinase [Chondromyces crocatus]AKT41041.1 protein kinase [Chondromyces crocatus]
MPRCPVDGLALIPLESLRDAEGDPFLGATIAERFVILGRLGAGSMGTVYRARQEAMGRDVAIKILRSDRAFDAQAKARFTREARAMSLLSSPHTVTVFDFGEIIDDSPDADLGLGAGGSLFLAMELLEGESLGQRLKRDRRLSVVEAARFARHALLSLAEAHEKGIIHRDLKPDNLFLTRLPSGDRQELCKVLDFGIAKVMSDGEQPVDALETQAGTVFGTPRYMSPEQAQGKPLDARSDLYSLGLLFYQMLVGRPPFIDDDAVVVMARHIKSTPLPPIEAAPDAGISRPLSDLLLRVLAKSPEDRPASAKEFIEAIERLVPSRSPADEAGSQETEVPPAEASATGQLLAVVDRTAKGSRAPDARRLGARAGLIVGMVALLAVLIALALMASRQRSQGAPREVQKYVGIAAGAAASRASPRSALDPPGPSPVDEPTSAPAPVAPSPTASPSTSAPVIPASRQVRPRQRNYEKFQ